MLIDIENPLTYPTEIQKLIHHYIKNQLGQYENIIKERKIEYDGDVQCAIEEYLLPYKAPILYEQLSRIMKSHDLICYHATKVLNQQIIFDYGLKTNDWKEYSCLMKQALISLNVRNIQEVIQCVYKTYNDKYSINGKPQLCFFSGLKLLRKREFDQFCQNIGGELARWSLEEKMPNIYQLLAENGIELIVKFKLSFSDVANHQQESIIYCFICYYAAKYFWSWHYNIEFDGITYKSINKDQIMELIHYEL